MDIFTVVRYLKYLLFSRHRKGHGVHSPFVFNFVSDVLRNKTESCIVLKIEKIRKDLLADKSVIQVNDLGAGSEKMMTNLRKVSDIARYSAVPKKYGIMLSNVAKAYGNDFILEFGTSLGLSSMYMAASCPGANVVTMEGCDTLSEIAVGNFKKAGLENITILTGPFDSLLPEIKGKMGSPGLVFIDGNHRKEAVISYFNQIAEISDNNSIIIIDDINSSIGMDEAWREIKNHKNVTFTIDLYRMGIVFFRKGISHFDYVIRY
jgi:predicted O-methyltransferase YrrM